MSCGYAIKQSTAPTASPVTVQQVKDNLQITHDTEDASIQSFIDVATEELETMLSRQLMPATWDLYLDRWPCGRTPILLPRNPVSSITSVTYTDTAGASQTWNATNYSTDIISEPARIILKLTGSYPETLSIPNVIQVRFVAGYANARAIPAKLRHWLLLRCGSYWRERAGISDSGQTELIAMANLAAAGSYGEEFSEFGFGNVSYSGE